MSLPVWLLPALYASASIGFISGMSGILPKPMSPPLFLFIVGPSWAIYLIFLITKGTDGVLDRNVITAITFVAWLAMMACAVMVTTIDSRLLLITIALGLIAATGNHALFTAIKLATEINQTGFPLAVFGTQSIFAFITTWFFTGDKNAVIRWVGFSGVQEGIAGTNVYQWIAFAIIISGCALMCVAKDL